MKKKFLALYQYSGRESLLRRILRRVIFSVRNRHLIEPTIFLNRNPVYRNYEIGDYTYGSRNGSPHVVYYGESALLTIGKFCSIADNVKIFLGGNHRIDWVTTFPFNVMFQAASNISGHPVSSGDIHIGHDVWIGEGAMILSGVSIGNGAVIAAGAVVVKDVPAYTIAGGNPAKNIRQRFDEATIRALEDIAWWNWDINKIMANIDLLLQADISAFIKKHAHSE